eukprot:TRINITY_DN27148_c1_g1_i1.p2 TRINITY_DN27148_c1_g1~~TRINITY_DN27148_c1_g1_i1.p2  ORF type:complete len:214 (+),score=99.01 TRINITY_DN27148_c1_g1_i1:114-755(+)
MEQLLLNHRICIACLPEIHTRYTMGKNTLDKERDDAMALIWGGAEEAKSSKRGKAAAVKRKRAEAEATGVTFDSDNEEEEKPKAKKTKKQKKVAENVADEKQRTLHMHVDNTTTRNDIRTLFEDYDPKVTIEKYKNTKKRGQFAVAVFKTATMADHAMERFNGTNQKELLNVEELVMSRTLSRRENKRMSAKKNKIKKALIRKKWEESKAQES